MEFFVQAELVMLLGKFGKQPSMLAEESGKLIKTRGIMNFALEIFFHWKQNSENPVAT